jgi:Rap1a immunity proteins
LDKFQSKFAEAAAMGNSATPLHATLMGAAAVILSIIAPVPTFAESEKTIWDVQELFKQCNYKGSLDRIFCLEFVSSIARQVFTNGPALKPSKAPPDLTRSIPSACPKSFVSNDAMVEAFNGWANEHLEQWRTSARIGVMQAMSDTWPCP